MKTRARILISNYGQDIIVKKSENDEPIYTQAFIQPLRCDQQSELYGDYDKKNAEQYLYIGLPEIKLSSAPNAVIIVDNQNYVIIKVEEVIFSNRVLYERAVLEKSES